MTNYVCMLSMIVVSTQVLILKQIFDDTTLQI